MLLISLLYLADRPVAIQFQHNPSTLKWLAKLATQLIDPFFITCISVGLLLLRREIFVKNALALGAGFFSARILKWVIGRPRPSIFFSEGVFECNPFSLSPDFQSFPSSHALAIFTLATSCSLIWPKYRVGIFILAGFLALSRVILHRHFLTDVVAGALLGFAITQKIGQAKLTRLKQ